jgi:hypothetical protein
VFKDATADFLSTPSLPAEYRRKIFYGLHYQYIMPPFAAQSGPAAGFPVAKRIAPAKGATWVMDKTKLPFVQNVLGGLRS